MLQKSVYTYECMNDWKENNETSFPQKQDFYTHLNLEDITDAGYTPGNRACKDFKRKSLKEYHDFYVQSYTLLLADVFI